MGSLLQSIQPQQVVVLRALNLGDILCAVPALRALRTALPDARIALVGLPWAEVFVERYAKYVDELIEFPGIPGFPERTADIQRFPHFLSSVQERRFDLAVQMHGAGSLSNPLTVLFGATHAAGFFRPGEYRPNRRSFWPYPDAESEVRRNLRLVRRLGAQKISERLEFPLLEADARELDQLRQEFGLAAGAYVCVHPGSRSASRRWPAERFATAADQLSRQGLQVVVTGTSSEADITRVMIDSMQHPAVDLTGKTSLGGLAALVDGSRLVICNDTGISHLAAALEAPSVVIFSASDPRRWAPGDRRLHRVLTGGRSVAIQQVVRTAQELLEESSVYAW